MTLATRAVNGVVSSLSTTDIVADPACGAGDLLVKCTPFLPLSDDLSGTLLQWGKQLIGYDLHIEFIRATKARLDSCRSCTRAAGGAGNQNLA